VDRADGPDRRLFRTPPRPHPQWTSLRFPTNPVGKLLTASQLMSMPLLSLRAVRFGACWRLVTLLVSHHHASDRARLGPCVGDQSRGVVDSWLQGPLRRQLPRWEELRQLNGRLQETPVLGWCRCSRESTKQRSPFTTCYAAVEADFSTQLNFGF